MTSAALVRVGLPAPRGGSYTYRLPDGCAVPDPGVRVLVPFGKRERVGFVEGESEAAPEGVEVRSIADVLDEECPVTPEIWRFVVEAARYYMVPLADVLRLAVAAIPWLDPRTRVEATEEGKQRARGAAALPGLGVLKGPLPERLLAAVARRSLSVGTLRAKLGTTGLSSAIARLLVQGAIVIGEPADREEGALPAGEPREGNADRTLSEGQREAVRLLRERLAEEAPRPVLLHGVTASGKTEVYLRAMKDVLAAGHGALYLAPEIALTEALVHVVRSSLGRDVAVLHSGMTEAARRRAMEALRSGRTRVALGPRSALFAPVRDLRLVVVDEEHEPSFKSQQHPRFHARDMAVLRAHLAGALVVLGSATPSVESYHWTERKKYERIVLSARARGGPMPNVELVDMRREFLAHGHPVILSAPLVESLQGAVQAGRQGIVLLNRRGYASQVLCRNCAQAVSCRSCSQGLVYHRASAILLCHLCGYRRPLPQACPSCGGAILELRGAGTERLLAEVEREVPGCTARRVDGDLTPRQIAGALGAFQAGTCRVLVGTQMIAKGHDFGNVAVVGVVGADAGLTLPDFRGAERTFALLTQVAGRGGRGAEAARVVLQCWNPAHYALQTACRQDYEAFYAQEIRVRSALLLPPRAYLALCLATHAKEVRAAALAKHLGELALATGAAVQVLGPAPAFRAKVKDQHRWQVLFKGRSRAAVRQALEPIAAAALDPRGSIIRGGGSVLWDLDPVELL